MTGYDSVGVIGIGNVGEDFTRWLLEEGYDVTAYDVSDERMDVAADLGASRGEHPADVAASVEAVVLSLPGRQYVEVVMEGENGVLEELGAGQVVIDTGSTPPDTEVHYENLCEERGAYYLESPLTWGGPGSYTEEHGPAYTMYVGGSEAAYDRAKELIDVLCYSHDHFGGIGKGQVVKAGGRLRQNNRAAVDAEMVEFLRNNGVDPEQVDDLMDWGLRDRFFEEDHPDVSGWEAALADDDSDLESVEDNSYELLDVTPHTKLRESHWTKDQAYALAIGHSSNTAMPITSTVHQLHLQAENYGSALFDRPLNFQDRDWGDREDVISAYRRLNRPAEEWRRVDRQADDE